MHIPTITHVLIETEGPEVTLAQTPDGQHWLGCVFSATGGAVRTLFAPITLQEEADVTLGSLELRSCLARAGAVVVLELEGQRCIEPAPQPVPDELLPTAGAVLPRWACEAHTRRLADEVRAEIARDEREFAEGRAVRAEVRAFLEQCAALTQAGVPENVRGGRGGC